MATSMSFGIFPPPPHAPVTKKPTTDQQAEMTVAIRTRLCVALVWCVLLVQLLLCQASPSRQTKLDNLHHPHRIILRKWQTEAPAIDPNAEIVEASGSDERFDEDEYENDWDDSGSFDVDAIEMPKGSGGEGSGDGSEDDDDGSQGRFSIDFNSTLDEQLAQFRKMFRHSSDASRTSEKHLQTITPRIKDRVTHGSRQSTEIDDLPAIRDELDKKPSQSSSPQLTIASATAILTAAVLAFVT